MARKIFTFIKKHKEFIICTHDPPDADGIGAELALAHILKTLGKKCRIINSSPVPGKFLFLDPNSSIEHWNDNEHILLPERSGMFILDTSDEYHIGSMRNIIKRTQETFVVDHHEPVPQSVLTGLNDPGAASTSELMVELAMSMGISLDPVSAIAAYSGIVYDTGFFSYAKTNIKSLKTALYLVEHGVVPYNCYRDLNENSSIGSLLLQKQVFSTLNIVSNDRVAIQVLRKEDIINTGGNLEDAENFINTPLKSKDIVVSIIIKENIEGNVRFSLRSKGTVNVSQIAQNFNGGGHVRASGFKCPQGIEHALNVVLNEIIKQVELQLDKA